MRKFTLLSALGLPIFIAALASSCSGGGENSSGSGGKGANGASSTGSAGGGNQGGGGDGGGFTIPDGGPMEQCEAPDVLILLDRTLTMHKTPEGNTPVDGPEYPSSKWYQAITAIEQLTAPPLDKGVRFGLSLWPRDPGDGCITLAERITNSKSATNPACEIGEIVVPPAVDNGSAIANYLNPGTTKLCVSTPTGNAVTTAVDYLQSIAKPGRKQYILLVTDGADWDQSCPDPNPLPLVEAAAAVGIETYVVGFSAAGDIQPGGVGAEFLNNLACAGRTAKGFPTPCTEKNGSYLATDPAGPALYLKAGNATELGLALKSVGGKLCCNCADSCDPPEMLFALDRTLTMHRTPEGNTPTDAPDYKSSKWYQAVTAIKKAVAPPRDQGVRFGLELWPRDPGAGQCITLAERVTNSKTATNPACQDGEIIVVPGIGTGTAIQNFLNPATTPICSSTPTGKGLLTATSHFLQSAMPGRDQYVVLVTDGADWDQSCPDPNPLPIVQDLAAAGIRTFVVGFSAEGVIQQGGVGAGFLNDMACAGQTAANFPASCKQSATGYVAADPNGPLLYLKAGNATELDAALAKVSADLCCDCVK